MYEAHSNHTGKDEDHHYLSILNDLPMDMINHLTARTLLAVLCILCDSSIRVAANIL